MAITEIRYLMHEKIHMRICLKIADPHSRYQWPESASPPTTDAFKLNRGLRVWGDICGGEDDRFRKLETVRKTRENLGDLGWT